ncbi:hypothetical protein ACN47E_000926 [Coniothyrium glycines]
MATFLRSPMSPSPAQDTFYIHSARDPAARFSGATTFACPDEAGIYTTTPTTLPVMTCAPVTRKRRSSSVSTSKSHLRESNNTLTEMLDSVQKELTIHRTIMLDMQSRIVHIERLSHLSTSSRHNPNSRGRPRNPRRCSLTLESQAWWEACQNFAHNCDTPFNAAEFLRTPRRFSGFDFDLEAEVQGKKHCTTPTAPPELEDVPALTPASDMDERDERVDTPETHVKLQEKENRGHDRAPELAPRHDTTDILERVVSFNKLRIPPPPILQSPPRSLRSNPSKTVSVCSRDESLTALPMMPAPVTPAEVVKQPQHRRIKSLFGYRSLKSKGEGKRRGTVAGGEL